MANKALNISTCLETNVPTSRQQSLVTNSLRFTVQNLSFATVFKCPAGTLSLPLYLSYLLSLQTLLSYPPSLVIASARQASPLMHENLLQNGQSLNLWLLPTQRAPTSSQRTAESDFAKLPGPGPGAAGRHRASKLTHRPPPLLHSDISVSTGAGSACTVTNVKLLSWDFEFKINLGCLAWNVQCR